ncbi:hypothetical protein [Candidatus Coxiella mudrowiae]|uniref:hypothetical protein n=1 Tax=Candidatus Coxiella mudrowiae TaxID=2054173 RepID=UPI001F3FAFAC|nr:hypothetical protein [Candidatus Coxiella mudrowiae]
MQSQEIKFARGRYRTKNFFRREKEFLKFSAQLETANKNLALYQQEVDMFRNLIESAYISKLDLIHAERALNSTDGTAFRLTKEILVT